MKKSVLCASLLGFIVVNVHSQDISLDTLYVSDNKTTYLVFDKAFDPNIDFVDMGTAQFQSKIEGETIFLKASSTKASPTSLMIKNGDMYYHGILQYSSNPEETFHDYRQLATKTSYQVNAHKETLQGHDNSGLNKTANIQERLDAVMKRPIEIHTLGVLKDRILLAVTNILTDKHTTYLQVLFHNKSSGQYEIDFVSFQFMEPSKRNGLKKGTKKTTDVLPLVQTPLQNIGAYEKQYLGYALPLFNLSNKGKLIITFREKSGSRTIELVVPAKAMLKTKIF